MLYSHFGPIWSTSYGHHLWTFHAGREFTYHDVLLPPWCHLLLTESEIRDLLARQFRSDTAAHLAAFVCHSEDQNQLFFDDYERIVAESPFETVFFKGYDAPDLAAKYPSAQSPGLLDELHRRYPERSGFLYDGITLLLRKSA